ncbi:MAG TPA: DinB family protein [Gemmatimonadaceae bacterium]|nr:DinB family protein [Gemmatimonadaceae bacterium]
MSLLRSASAPRVASIVDQLERAFHGGAWHGPSVLEALNAVTAATAAARPIADAHSIWEIVLHLTGWKHEVCRRVEGADPGMPSNGDWPEPEAPSEDAWVTAREELEAAHRRLIAATRLMQETRLGDMVGAHRDSPLGTGVSFHAMLLGVAQHDAYHAGQVVLLKKAARE